MIIKEFQKFEEARTRARAYFCYLLRRNIPEKLPDPNINQVQNALYKIMSEVDDFETLYILDKNGIQITENITNKVELEGSKGSDRSNRSYFYRAVQEKRCVLTDPYPSSLTNDLTVTAAYPVYNIKDELVFIACIDISLEDLLKISQPTNLQTIFGNITTISYSMFSAALLSIAFLLFYNGIDSLLHNGILQALTNIDMMFKSTILLTLSLAIFDLVKTIFEEEVLGRNEKNEAHDIHKTMVRFLGSIIIALAIEALMLVFKFAITDPKNILTAIYLIGGVSLLLISLAFYVKMVSEKNI